MKNILKRLKYPCALILFAFAISACDDWFDDDDDDHDDTKNIGRTFAKGLDTPWEMQFAPDGSLFLSQRPGIISIVDASGNAKPWLRLDSVVEEVGESGLFGIALDPDYQSNHYVYFGYTYASQISPIELTNKIVRYKNDDGKPVFDKVLLDNIRGNHLHNVGAFEFGPDEMLYVTVGEVFAPALAQDKSSLNGKILRMTRDGGVPDDNPIAGSYIFSLGHRNPQGLAFQPGTGNLFSTEHGPSEQQGCCMDEINLIQAGHNYGWPLIRGSQQQAGLETPVYHSGDTTTWAPTGGIFLVHGEWKGSMLFTGLRGQALYRVVFKSDDATQIDKVERYLYRALGRLRNVAEGPDGKIYVAVSNQDGRGDPLTIDDRIVVFDQKEVRQYAD
ncbi:PQQ-dependent sugar dehydrogenase [Pseudochryseolinea flava]|nr:PQQ-dependent sugar dehydrogenase [Pseudochryseolinea flava]